jgi:aromatic-L-amino-acid decarboxylase
MLTTFDCCAMWVADVEPLKAVLSLTPVFLRALGNAYDYKDWQIPLGRRFRWVGEVRDWHQIKWTYQMDI